MATKPKKHKLTIISRHFFLKWTISRLKTKQVLSDSNRGPLTSQLQP